MTTPASPNQPRFVEGYVDQVVRKQQFLAAHPDVEITAHPDDPPRRYWSGQVPGCIAVTSGDLERLLDMLEYQVAAHDAHLRWPRWTFLRSRGSWQAKEIDGPELVFGRTIGDVEARVQQCERLAKAPHSGKTWPGAGR